MDDRDAVGGGADVELQVLETLGDGAPEPRDGVLQPGQIPDVPAAVGVGPRVWAVEVRMLLKGSDEFQCASRR